MLASLLLMQGLICLSSSLYFAIKNKCFFVSEEQLVPPKPNLDLILGSARMIILFVDALLTSLALQCLSTLQSVMYLSSPHSINQGRVVIFGLHVAAQRIVAK